jgi:pilus assembly protein CpaF
VASTAQAILETEVRELVRRRGIDPIAEPEVVGRLVDEVVGDYRDRAITSALPPLGDVVSATRTVLDAVAGFGPLQPLLDDSSVEEIWINEPGRVFIARHGRSELTTLILTADQVAELVERMLRPTGRRIDLSTPFVDAMLPDGSRLHVVIPNITRRHMAVNIRSRYARVTVRCSCAEPISADPAGGPLREDLARSNRCRLGCRAAGGGLQKAGSTARLRRRGRLR